MIRNEKAVAVFDFDGTLTSRNTTIAFLHYAAPLRFYWLTPVLTIILALYLTRLISIDQLNQWLMHCFFKGKSKDQLCKIGHDFALNKLPSFIRPEAMLKLKEHQKNAHPCILATAAYDIYIKAWGKLHGFTEVLCTEIVCDSQGNLTGQLKGKSCYGPEKVNKIKQVLPQTNIIIYAYGDSVGDREMLQFATHSFYRRFDSKLS